MYKYLAVARTFKYLELCTHINTISLVHIYTMYVIICTLSHCVSVFSPEPLSVAVHYSFHGEHYAWVWCTTSSKTSTMSFILSYRYYMLVVMREDGILHSMIGRALRLTEILGRTLCMYCICALSLDTHTHTNMYVFAHVSKC